MPSDDIRLRAVLLDIDGTLIDSNDAHARAWVDTFAEFGYQVPFERVRPLIGMGSDKLLPASVGIEKESDEGKKLIERRTKIFLKRYVPTLRPFAQVRELLERMRTDGIRLVVATSANEEELDALLGVAGVGDLLYEATTSSDAKASKPEPDIVEAALERAEVGADEVLMLGDTPYDIEAAGEAGVDGVVVRCGGWWKDANLSGAIAIYDDPADLLARYDSSPFSGQVAGWVEGQ